MTATPTPTPGVVRTVTIRICGLRVTITIFRDGRVTYDPPLAQVLPRC